MQQAASPTFELHCVVQLGFAGSRRLINDSNLSEEDQQQLEGTIQEKLREQLKELPGKIGMEPNQFLCGISQLAIGADMLFTRACRELKIPQRIFLPQSRLAFLSATGSDGSPDFSDEQHVEAEALFAAEHIIQERVVSDSAIRRIRFEDTNLEILRVSDVVVCLIGENATSRPGGTSQLLQGAIVRGKPTLELRVSRQNGTAVVTPTWHNLSNAPPQQLCQPLDEVRATALNDLLPSCDQYTDALKQYASERARAHRRFFRFAALVIVLTHLTATILATMALVSHDVFAAFDSNHQSDRHHNGDHGTGETIVVSGLLLVEVGLLLTGFFAHHKLHHSRASENWALSRLLAEICRSVRSLENLHLYLGYLFARALPSALRPLLRTLNVLHLNSTWDKREDDWRPSRDGYVRKRLVDEQSGQISFFDRGRARARHWRKIADTMFMICSVAAVFATTAKLVIVLSLHDDAKLMAAALGAFAIVLPVLAVAALSLVAAMDLRALEHTYSEMQQFLELQLPLIQQAESRREFELLLIETESRLLGEVAHWFSRRSFLGVT